MSSGERTEHPTARRLRKAREDGQAPRSAELSATIVMVVSMIILVLAGTWLATGMAGLMKVGLSLDRKVLNSPGLMASAFAEQLVGAFGYVLPVLLISALAAMAASVANGGVVLSFSAVLPKFSKLNPVNGMGRMFGPRAVTELGKSLLKFILVGIVLLAVLRSQAPDLARLGHMGLQPALASSGRIVLESALWVTLSLLIIAAIDVPLQRRQFIKGLRMTKQEIKDEMKEAEGRPEVRAQIRRRQREMASAKMMSRVKDADVIITNPDHFAVALSYDPASDAPPLLVAKGIDHLALRIRAEGGRQGVTVFEAPPLARALFFTTELEHPVPEDLYFAVAQVIAYVYSLSNRSPGVAPSLRPVPRVPDSMLFDASGRRPAESSLDSGSSDQGVQS